VANPDQWPTIEPYYDLASAGSRVDALVIWYLKDEPKGIHAEGRVEAYDTLGGLAFGLRGKLDQRMQPLEEQSKFVPIEVETATIYSRGAGGSNTRAKVTAPSLGVTQTVDDPLGGRYFPPSGWAFLWQFWPPIVFGPEGGREQVPPTGVEIYLINVWAHRHLDPTIATRVQDILAGRK
jgi:hypothetical protein